MREGIRFAVGIILLSLSSIGAQTRWYASNESGMAFEEIPSFRVRSLDRVLEVYTSSGLELRRLLDAAGLEVKSWRIERYPSGKVRVFEVKDKGIVSSIERYREDGWMESLEEYGDGELVRKIVYAIKSGRLSTSIATDSAGAILYEDSYAYGFSGALRQVVRKYPDGRVESAGASFAGSRPLELRYGTEDAEQVERYDADGKRISLESWKGGELLFSSKRAVGDGGLGSEIVQDPGRGVRVERDFDRSGRIKEERSLKDSNLVSRTLYSYDQSGNLSRKTTIALGRRERVEYECDGSGAVTAEMWYLDDRLWKEVSYFPPSDREERIIRDGQAIMRVRYEGGRKAWEETIRNGKVVRRREIR